MLVDSHCHLDFPDYAGQVDAVVARARDAGVGACVSIGTELKRFPGVRAVAEQFPNVWCSVGVHPHEAEKELLDGDRAAAGARPPIPKSSASARPGSIIITNIRRAKPQQANFRAHIAAARKTGLPVIVHTRDADDDTIEILRRRNGQGRLHRPDPLLHRHAEAGRRGAGAGLYISVSGIATFKNSGALRDVIKTVPLDRLLVETDAPFLAPMPHRGKTNEPAFVVHTAQDAGGAERRERRRTRRRHHRQFLPPVHQGQRPARRMTHCEVTHPGLRLLRRRAAAGRRGRRRLLGRLRSRQSQEPPQPLLHPGAPQIGCRRNPRAGRYLARPARAVAGRRASAGWMAC